MTEQLKDSITPTIKSLYEQLSVMQDVLSNTLNELADINTSISGFSPFRVPKEAETNAKVDIPRPSLLLDFKELSSCLLAKGKDIEQEISFLRRSIS